MLRSVLLLWLCFTALVHASVTAAWRVPVEVFAPGYRKEGALIGDPSQPKPEKAKLAKPPAKSAFFQLGDELWDVSEEVMARAESGSDAKLQWSGEWMVWNARSQMIVARGSAADIMVVDAALDRSELPVVVKTKLELVKGTDRKVHELSLLSASGESASGRAGGMEAKVRGVNLNQIDGVTGQEIDVRWEAGDLEAKVLVHLDLYDSRTRIARFGNGADQWELFATGGLAYSHGVPVSEVRWKEVEGKLEVWPTMDFMDSGELAMVPLADELQIGILAVRSHHHIGLDLGDAGDEAAPDPFQTEASPSKRVRKIPASGDLAKWISGDLIDVRTLLQENGLKFAHPRAFAGYDQHSRRLFLVSSRVDIQLCEQILGGIGCAISSGAWTETDAPSGNWGLACRSGEESRIELSLGERRAGFSIRPDFSESFSQIDTAYQLDILAGDAVAGSFESQMKFIDALPTEVGSYRSPEGKETKVILTVDAAYP